MNNKSAKTFDPFEYIERLKTDDEIRTFKRSLALPGEINVLSILDPDALRYRFKKKIYRMRVINENEFHIYENPNPSGNSLCSLGLNKKNGDVLVSNSDNARFSARNRLIEIIKANTDFNYFFTGTFNPKKWDRKNFSELHSSLTRWLRRRGIKYILIPEPHKDGSIHFHGFFNETIEPYLSEFDLSKNLPARITDGIKEGRKILNCPEYAKMFGWVSIEKIRSLEACAVYVSKYVSKSFDNDEARFTYHRYFCSTGLKRPFFDIPNEKYLEINPERFSSKIVKATYKRQNPTVRYSLEPLGGPFEPSGLRNASGVLKIPFLPAVGVADKPNEGGTVEPYPLGSESVA